MSPRGRRLLSDAEIALWLKVAESVAIRDGAVLPQRKARPAPTLPPVAEPDSPPPRAYRVPSYAPPVQPPKPAGPPLAPFEKRYRQRVSHGRIDIEGVIDLHGLTQPQAHGALLRFLHGAQRNGSRLVLVVTGKGRTRAGLTSQADTEPGVLRRAVPLWLREPDLRAVVLGFEEAAQPHGGMGALYVRLRKPAS